MSSKSITIRLPEPLHDQLNDYALENGISKTQAVVAAISQYLGVEQVSVITRMELLEQRMEMLEAHLRRLGVNPQIPLK
ncbi:MAG: hypothetical protein VKK42_24665 [Lyngbya sp.]|nr:hypothetical protein [Lyngbya sp.]